MSQGLFTAVSGIRACQAKIDVIADNIANMNTTGFKTSQLNFATVFSKTLTSGSTPASGVGGTNPMQVGLGVAIGEIGRNFTGGSIMSTGRTTDLNIQGQGFFTVMNSEGSIFLTRAGNFSTDSNGNLVTAQGFKVLGGDSLLGSSASTTPVRIPQSIKFENTVTDGSGVATNLVNSEGTALTEGSITLDLNGTQKTYNIEKGVTSLEDLQTQISADFTELDVQITDGKLSITNNNPDAADADPDNDADNDLAITATGTNFLSALGLADTVATGQTSTSGVLKDTTKVTLGAPDSSSSTYPMSSYSFGNDGSIEVTYANGDKITVSGDPRSIYYKGSTGVEVGGSNITVNDSVVSPAELQLQLASVVNPKGLVSQGGNMFAFGPNSGDPTFSIGQNGGMGKIDSGGLESSNVDLPSEFSDMILAQRGIDANSRTFEAQNTIMRTIVNLGRG